MSRPTALFGVMEGDAVSYRACRAVYARRKREALADGDICRREALELLALMEGEMDAAAVRLVNGVTTIGPSMALISAIVGGAAGMDSVRARRLWDDRQREIGEEGWEEALTAA